jgi:hypothetical protein
MPELLVKVQVNGALYNYARIVRENPSLRIEMNDDTLITMLLSAGDQVSFSDFLKMICREDCLLCTKVRTGLEWKYVH